MHGERFFADIAQNSAPVASESFDVYVREGGKHRFRGAYFPSQGAGKSYVESRLKFYNRDMKDIVLYFPLNSALSDVYIGLREGSEILPPMPYTYERPIVFYGSSIVHGGGTRPSSPYSAVLSRRLDSNFINLGFGGGAKAEKAIMEYIAGLDMSAFVYDYDHNAPTLGHLRDTHYEGYRIFRSKQPDTPVIMASRPDYWSRNYTLEYYTVEETEKRRALIEENYKRALAEGDRNVYFLDGERIFTGNYGDCCTVDGGHPNDLGFMLYAEQISDILRRCLREEKF